MEHLIGILIGVSLAASCGFRVFVPMFVLSVAGITGVLPLDEGWQWMGEWPAVIAFGVATGCEIAAYYIPWFDNALDTLATPSAVIAGSVAAAAVMTDLPPLVQWSVAILAGGGAAGGVQTGTVLLRGASTALTGGLANFLVATFELVIAFVLAILAIIAPIFAALALGLIAFLIIRRLLRRPPEKKLEPGKG